MEMKKEGDSIHSTKYMSNNGELGLNKGLNRWRKLDISINEMSINNQYNYPGITWSKDL